ncbi:hypothetical protein ABPG73_022437 [Tetrahymena malaccensis]
MKVFILFVFIQLKQTIQSQTYRERNIISVIDFKDNEQLSEFKCVDQTDFQYNDIQWINIESKNQNIQFFQYYKQIPPHYQLEINIDFLFFNQKKNFNIFINEKQYEIVYEDESLHIIKCNKDKLLNPSLNDSDELALTKFLFTPFKDQKIEIIIDLEEKNYVGIQNLYVNILPCHPTCLECSGPEENKCTKCSKNNPIDGKCSDCDNYFQDGQCVNKCDESKFLFPFDDQKQKICIYSHNCEKFDKGSCIQCNMQSRYIFNGECVVICPIGYIQSQNSNNCEIDKSNKQNGQSKMIEIVNAFYNSFFSDLEVNALNIKTSQFINSNELKRVTTQCGNRKVLGGFLANKLNSQIEFEVPSNNCKNVIFYFNFIIIDYVDGIDLDGFTLQLNDLSEPIQLSSQNKYEKSNMCGDKIKEEHTYQYSKTFDQDKTKGETQNIKVKIINNNKQMENNEKGFDKKNKHPFFGISGLKVFCTQDILCDQNCQECDQNDQNICLKCKQGFNLSQNKICIEEIKCDSDSYLDDSNKCKKCSEELQNCLECDSNKQCKKCSNSFILENEKCVCDQNSYLKGQNECIKCQDSFPNCFQCDSNSCIKCGANYQLHEKHCFPCKSGEQTSNDNCQKCLIVNCKFCYEQTDKCQQCENGYKLNQEKCEKIQCEQTEFLNQQSNICQSCISKFENCNQCNQNECQSCIDKYYLNSSTNQCVSDCPKGTFVNSNNQCEPCKQQNCIQCSSSQLCQKCEDNYQLHKNECFLCKKNETQSQCQQCLVPNCKICSESTDKCEECEIGFDLNQQKCEEIKCKQNQFYNQSNKVCEDCQKKFENCNLCSSDKCNHCIDQFYLDKSNNKCVSNCPKGTFINDNKQCEQCQPLNCQECVSVNVCQKCEDNYQLHDNQCFHCKKDGLNEINNSCQQCKKLNCKRCSESTDKCEECDFGYQLNQFSCKKIECQQNQYLNEKQECQLCSNKFKNCFNCSLNECESCQDSFYFDKSSQTCVQKCPHGTFESNKKCEICQHKNCKECDKNRCTSCQKDFYLHNQDCQDNCDGLLIYKQGQKCLSSCLYPLIKQEKECVLKCKDGFYFDEDFRECQKCKTGCSLCQDKYICLTCEEGYEHNNILNKCNEKQKPTQEEQKAYDICEYEDQSQNLCFDLYTQLQGYRQIYDYLAIISIIYIIFQLLFMTSEYTISLYFLLVAQLRGNSVFLLDEMFIYYTQAFIKVDYGFNVFNILPNMFQVNNSSILYKIKSFDSIWLVKNIFTDFLNNYFYQSILIGLIILFFVISKLINLIFKKLRRLTRYLCYKMLFLAIIISSNQLLISLILQLQNEGLNKIEFFISIPYILVYISYFSFIVKQICFSEFDSMQLEKLGAVCYQIKQKRIQQVFWVIFEAKKIILVAFILILPNKTIALIIDLILSFAFMIYIIITKPLIQQNQNLVIVVQELLSLMAKMIQIIVISDLEISFSSFSTLLKIFEVALICIQILTLSRGFIIFMNFIFQKFQICTKKSKSNQLNQSSQIVSFNNIQLNTNTIFEILQQSDRSINLSKVGKKKYK